MSKNKFVMGTYGYDFKSAQWSEFSCFICFSRTICSDSRVADMMKIWQMEDFSPLFVLKKNDRVQVPGTCIALTRSIVTRETT